MSGISEASREWWREREAARVAAAKSMSDTHFADPAAAIPDLDFRPPDCPICLEETTAEDGDFLCDVCRIHWPSNRYGAEAQRWDP